MGRYITGSGAGGGGAGMRNERHVITANTPALAVPVWAKLVKVSGVGGGAGGGNKTTAGIRGAGGGSGGVARDAILPVAAEATIAITVGAGGAGASGGSNAVGGDGGNTVITLGSKAITLFGGTEGSADASSTANGGDARMGAPGHYAAFAGESARSAGAYQADGNNGLYFGFGGLRGDSDVPGGAGAASPYGAGGAVVAYPVAANTVGANGVGYGSGGAGGHGTGKGGDGAPGLVIIEFLEAA